jgi:ABC-type transport system involved in multi-copper enzyme maturation permease subunit
MIKALTTIALETFLLLRRDKVFFPAAVVGLAFAFFAGLASDWSIEDFSKILFDVGAFGYHITGGIVALFWGTKSISDSRQSGALEVQMSLPISRTIWLLGKYLGMCLALLFLSVILLVVWQYVMYTNRFGIMNDKHLIIFAFITLNWMVLAAVSMFFASFCTSAVALFNSSCLWVAGLMSPAIERTLSPQTPEFTRELIQTTSKVWNLQQFLLADYANILEIANFPGPENLMWRAIYGLSLIVLLMTSACFIFRNRDLVG